MLLKTRAQTIQTFIMIYGRSSKLMMMNSLLLVSIDTLYRIMSVKSSNVTLWRRPLRNPKIILQKSWGGQKSIGKFNIVQNSMALDGTCCPKMLRSSEKCYWHAKLTDYNIWNNIWKTTHLINTFVFSVDRHSI